MREAMRMGRSGVPRNANTMMETIMTVSRNAVPQRGCAAGKSRTFSFFSGSLASWVWTAMCSAAW